MDTVVGVVRRRVALVVLVLVAGVGAYFVGSWSRPSSSSATGSQGAMSSSTSMPTGSVVRSTTTNPETGRPPRTLAGYEQALVDFVPTTAVDATPEARTRNEIDVAVRGFIRGWTLDASTDERLAALLPYMSTPTMAQAYALADPAETPRGTLAAAPVITLGTGTDSDSASAFVQFDVPGKSLSTSVEVVHIDAGWRVYMLDAGGR